VRWTVAVANPRTRAHIRAVGADEGGHTLAWIGFWSTIVGWVVGPIDLVCSQKRDRENVDVLLAACTRRDQGKGFGRWVVGWVFF
jgi:hypothetical protein